MQQLAIFCYSLSFIFQLCVTTLTISLIKKTKKYKLGWLFLSVAFFLMLGRRALPILNAINFGKFDIADALLSVPISGFLFLGALGLKKLLEETNKLNIKLLRITKTDYLTSALSRQEAFERAILEITRSARTMRPLALLSIDIDHFKRINDIFGHHVGDEVLQAMVKFFKENIRAIDFIGRLGGEEFLIVLPETNESAALEVANRLRTSLSKVCCHQHCGTEIKITVSIGVALINPEKKVQDYAQMLESYLEKADSAMYEAKKHGRNRCVLFKPKP